jgi:hypothetical protein
MSTDGVIDLHFFQFWLGGNQFSRGMTRSLLAGFWFCGNPLLVPGLRWSIEVRGRFQLAAEDQSAAGETSPGVS